MDNDIVSHSDLLEGSMSYCPSIIFLLKAEGGLPVEYVSENVSRIGYSADDFLSKKLTFEKIVCPEDLERFSSELRTYSEKGISNHSQEYRILTADGDIRWMDGRTVAKRNAHGDITHYQVVILDITHRKRIEKRLSDSEQRYHSMVEKINDGMVVVQDGIIVFVNSQFAGILGYTVEEAIGMSYLDMLSPSCLELVRSRHNKRLENDATCPTRYELTLLTKQGAEVSAEINASYIEHEGKPAIIGILRDISLRKRNEDRIKRSLEIQQTLTFVSSTLLTSPDLDKAINISLSHIGNLCDACRAYVFLFGENDGCMSNTHEWCADGVGPQKDNLQEIPVDTFPWWMQKLSNGEMIHITSVRDMPPEASAEKELLEMQDISSLLVIPLFIDKRTCGFIGLDNVKSTGSWSQDDMAILGTVSHLLSSSIENERKKVQIDKNTRKLSETNMELQRSVKVKDAFLANMSHELRTPLNSIIGYSDMLLSGIAGEINEKQCRYLNHISSSGKHLLEIINDILDISKVESGKMELLYETIHVSYIIESVINIVSPMADRKQIDLIFNNKIDGMLIEADPVRFKQIISNLLINAIKFTDERGEVSIDVKKERDLLNVSIGDSGIGIAPEDKDKLFQPFQQLDSSYARKYEGTGLGLALVKDLVELHGGNIWVESEPCKGSIFSFTIPLCRK
ncbi:MAG: PAS domain S-box protein [Methanosarcinaceae archaeon]|nr:PAS domain S-box protein [Methanosarcinaceae archaeon]